MARAPPRLTPSDARFPHPALCRSQGEGSRQQRNMRLPELSMLRRELGQLGCTKGNLVVREGQMPEDMGETIAELVAKFDDTLVSGAAMRAGITDRKSTRLNSSHYCASRVPSSA